MFNYQQHKIHIIKVEVMEANIFAVITKESVSLMAEAAGFTLIPDDVATLLGEDISYRLREMTMVMASTLLFQCAL